MRASHTLAALGLSLILASCGGGSPGESCNTEGLLCNDASSALECRLGTWRALPCRGPGGCKEAGDKISCDMSANMEGDACASSTEGQGICAPGGKAALTCRSGTLVKTNDCASCTIVGDQVSCQ